MEGFNDVWANILNGDIINNSENISEHPSLAVNNKKFIEKKVDISANNQMMGDISVINTQEGANRIANVIVPNDLSKEEGEIFLEITSALNPEQKALVKERKYLEVSKEETKHRETKHKSEMINIEENNDLLEKADNSEMPSAIGLEESKEESAPPSKQEESQSHAEQDEGKSDNIDSKAISIALDQPNSNQKVDDPAVIESKPDSPLKEEKSRESL
eukprot:CAMPEP_0197018124 /NCGR_PEP_ID=MMETSP1380-20130617/79926_1 /TAXON_ID=5936 /ORGANISM="Euplotes crassus, Strain CT5" /LENGTH=216 /DNA_ID=CAMNT_0042445303 /DNA_START=1184 /DNA_END=1834 /DNA_ORIENTATION=-